LKKITRLSEAENRIEYLKTLNRELDAKIINYEESFKLREDEKLASEIKYNVLMQQFEKVKKEYADLVTQSLQFKQEQIEKINKQNELENERRQQKLKQEIEKASQPAASDVTINLNTAGYVPVGPMNQYIFFTVFLIKHLLRVFFKDHFNKSNYKTQVMNIPIVTKAIYKFDSHEGEVNCVKYHKSGKFFATGGGDRKIKLWEFKDGKCDLMGSLIGSNASIVSIDIDNEVWYFVVLALGQTRFDHF
jgi:autophagy-related protein 16